MLHDFKSAAADSVISCDICIIGSGPAGTTVARALLGTGLTVCLLESGGIDFEGRSQSLSTGENRGLPYYDLHDTRLRLFGGTAHIWGGRCAELNPIDFERRSWLPHSGWPLTADDLAPWYQRAHRAFGIESVNCDESLWERFGESSPFSPDQLRVNFWQFDEMASRFGIENCQDLVRAPDINIYLHATATNIEADPAAGMIRHLDIASIDGPSGRVKARHYVVACGGIDTPRLLLASNRAETNGIGNTHGMVGRFFMEHPHGRAAIVHANDPYRLWRLFHHRFTRDGRRFSPVIRPGEALQERAGILNTSLVLKFQPWPEKGVPITRGLYGAVKHKVDPNRYGRAMWQATRRLNRWFQRTISTGVRRLQLGLESGGLFLLVRGEQAPNPDSRILLSGRRDALGVPLADLHWQMSPIDKHSVAMLVKAVDGELRRRQWGSAQIMPWLEDGSDAWPQDPTVGNHPIGGYHHMGTTRMADDPGEGVVDRNCRVHGYQNLFVSGSSVFPTSGWANPTLTIVALADRLGHHLKDH